MKVRLFILVCCLIPASMASFGQLPQGVQQQIDSMIYAELNQQAFPGATFVCGTADTILYAQNYGFLDYSQTVPVDDNTLYDVASCTKVLATTFVLMHLYDQGLVQLDLRLGSLLPQFSNTPIQNLTITELLTHTSGLRPMVIYPELIHPANGTRLFSNRRSEQYPYLVDRNLYMIRDIVFDSTYLSTVPQATYRKVTDSLWINPAFDTVIQRKIIQSYRPERRGRYLYNDSNMYLLRLIAEHLTHKKLDTLAAELFGTLHCDHTGFRPLEWHPRNQIAPTEEDYLMRRHLLQGYVHDELAAVSDGIGGNAGLYSTGHDMARFCQLLLNHGSYNNQQIIDSTTIDLFTSSLLVNKGIYRGLGFDKRGPASGFGGTNSFGHTGFTGTIFWIDRDKQLFMVFLSNSIYPTRTNKQLSDSQLRLKLWKVLQAIHP